MTHKIIVTIDRNTLKLRDRFQYFVFWDKYNYDMPELSNDPKMARLYHPQGVGRAAKMLRDYGLTVDIREADPLVHGIYGPHNTRKLQLELDLSPLVPASGVPSGTSSVDSKPQTVDIAWS